MDWFAVSSPESLCIIQLRKYQRFLLGQERGEDVPLRALSGRKESSSPEQQGNERKAVPEISPFQNRGDEV